MGNIANAATFTFWQLSDKSANLCHRRSYNDDFSNFTNGIAYNFQAAHYPILENIVNCSLIYCFTAVMGVLNNGKVQIKIHITHTYVASCLVYAYVDMYSIIYVPSKSLTLPHPCIRSRVIKMVTRRLRKNQLFKNLFF